MTITLTREEAQQVHDALLYFEGDISDVMFAALTTLRARLAQPEPEPVAYTTGHCENHKQKGGCQLHNLQCGWPDCDRKPITTPPKREWQGLTYEDMNKLRHLVDWTVPLDIKKFARAIEAKLKEKNT
jgi:hypothetical protein